MRDGLSLIRAKLWRSRSFCHSLDTVARWLNLQPSCIGASRMRRRISLGNPSQFPSDIEGMMCLVIISVMKGRETGVKQNFRMEKVCGGAVKIWGEYLRVREVRTSGRGRREEGEECKENSRTIRILWTLSDVIIVRTACLAPKS